MFEQLFNYPSTTQCEVANMSSKEEKYNKRSHRSAGGDGLFLFDNINFNITFDDKFSYTTKNLNSSRSNELHKPSGFFGTPNWLNRSKSDRTITKTESSSYQSFLFRFNSPIVFMAMRNINAYRDLSLSRLMFKGSNSMRLSPSPASSENLEKLSLMRQIVTGVKLSSLQFSNLQTIKESMHSTLFTWLTTYIDDRFNSYPDEYIFDILIITFMEHQGTISIKEFDLMLWTIVGMNENLISKNQNHDATNPRAEKIANMYEQVQGELFGISEKNHGENIAIIGRLRMMKKSKNNSMSSFNEHYFIDQHALYVNRQTLPEDHQFNNRQKIFNILEDKLNLHLFNRMKLEISAETVPSQQIAESSNSSNDRSPSKMNKLKSWLKKRLARKRTHCDI